MVYPMYFSTIGCANSVASPAPCDRTDFTPFNLGSTSTPDVAKRNYPCTDNTLWPLHLFTCLKVAITAKQLPAKFAVIRSSGHCCCCSA